MNVLQEDTNINVNIADSDNDPFPPISANNLQWWFNGQPLMNIPNVLSLYDTYFIIHTVQRNLSGVYSVSITHDTGVYSTNITVNVQCKI